MPRRKRRRQRRRRQRSTPLLSGQDFVAILVWLIVSLLICLFSSEISTKLEALTGTAPTTELSAPSTTNLSTTDMPYFDQFNSRFSPEINDSAPASNREAHGKRRIQRAIFLPAFNAQGRTLLRFY